MHTLGMAVVIMVIMLMNPIDRLWILAFNSQHLRISMVSYSKRGELGSKAGHWRGKKKGRLNATRLALNTFFQVFFCKDHRANTLI